MLVDVEAACQLYREWRSEIKATTREKLMLEQDRDARQMLTHASQHTELWRSLMAGQDPAAVRWAELPITNRDLLSQQFEQSVTDSVLTRDIAQEHFRISPAEKLLGKYHLFISAGKTGQLGIFVYDEKMWNMYLSSVLRRFYFTHFDFESSPRVAFIGTSDPAHTLTRTSHLFPNADTCVLGLQQGLNYCVQELQAFQPDIIIGFSSAVGLFANEQHDGRLAIQPKVVLVGTDQLSANSRKEINEVWETQLWECYAATEGGTIAFECPYREGLHINEDMVLVEVVDEQLVITNLVNKVQPFIRYALPDRVKLLEAPCSCGLPYARILPLSGRSLEVLHVPGQNCFVTVHPIVFRSALDRLPGVKSSEVHYDSGILEVKIGGQFSYAEAEIRLINALQQAGVNMESLMLKIVSSN